jgi:glyoxylase-like metal-dependent hydrolase (beta-lactamase superfamily II)
MSFGGRVRALSLWFVLLWLALGASRAQTAPPQAVQPVQPVQVAPGVYFVHGLSALGTAANRNFISNAGFIVTPAGVVVVDALGSPALAEEMLRAIRAVTPLPVRHVIVTHYHADHVYGLQVFEAAGAEIVAHAGGREYMVSETARLRLEASRQELKPWIDAATRLTPAARWLDKDLDLQVGGVEIQVRHVGPAHTGEDLVVHVPARRVHFAGDLVFRGRVPFVGQADSRSWIAALDRLLAFDPAVMLPGHGPASTEPRADLQLTRDYLAYLRTTMGEAARNMEPFDEVYRRTDWSRFEHLPLFAAANRMNAYNTYLLMEQQAK